MKREFLFDARTDFYITDQREGFEWGWMELDGRYHTIVRTGSRDFLDHIEELRRRKLKLSAVGEHSGRSNIYLRGKLKAAQPCENIAAPIFINLRSGATYQDEDAMWGSAREGDVVFYSSNPNNLDSIGYVVHILDLRNRKFDHKQGMTLKEAQEWRSSK